MKLTIDFDEYETALLKKAKTNLGMLAKVKGEQPLSLKNVVKGAVRMGIHTMYGEDFVTKDIISDLEDAGLIPAQELEEAFSAPLERRKKSRKKVDID